MAVQRQLQGQEQERAALLPRALVVVALPLPVSRWAPPARPIPQLLVRALRVGQQQRHFGPPFCGPTWKLFLPRPVVRQHRYATLSHGWWFAPQPAMAR